MSDNEHDDPPQITWKHTKVARPMHPLPDDETQHKIRMDIAKRMQDASDEYLRLSMLGYRLMQDDEILPPPDPTLDNQGDV